MNRILKTYFYWTQPRGSFHYDVMVSLILLFIFVTPFLWDFGARPTSPSALSHPIQVVGDGGRGLIVTMRATDVPPTAGASNNQMKNILRKAIEPIAGDAVFVERWETAQDADGNLVWKIWAHR